MIVDSRNKTVTFKDGESVNPLQLTGLANFLQSSVTVHVEQDLPQWEKDLLSTPFTPKRAVVESFTKPGTFYTVMLLTANAYACTCPDFTIRRVLKGSWCKHISRVVFRDLWEG